MDAKARLLLTIESADPQRLVELSELCRRQRADALDQISGRDCDQPGARDKATPSDRDANDARGRKALVNADVYLDGQAVGFVTGGFDDEHRPDLVRVVPEDYDGATLVGLNPPDLTSLNGRDFVFVHSKTIPLSRGATPSPPRRQIVDDVVKQLELIQASQHHQVVAAQFDRATLRVRTASPAQRCYRGSRKPARSSRSKNVVADAEALQPEPPSGADHYPDGDTLDNSEDER